MTWQPRYFSYLVNNTKSEIMFIDMVGHTIRPRTSVKGVNTLDDFWNKPDFYSEPRWIILGASIGFWGRVEVYGNGKIRYSHEALCLKNLTALILFIILSVDFANSQEARGDPAWKKQGIMDGNLVRTIFLNHGEVALWPFQPSGECPKGAVIHILMALRCGYLPK